MNISLYWEEPGWATLNVNGVELSLQADTDWADVNNPVVDPASVELINRIHELVSAADES